MTKHLATDIDPGLLWADSNLGLHDAAVYLAGHRATIARRREERHRPSVAVRRHDGDDVTAYTHTGFELGAL